MLMAAMQRTKVLIFPGSHDREIVKEGDPQKARMRDPYDILLEQGSMLVYDARLVLSLQGTFLEKSPYWMVVCPRRWPGDVRDFDDSIGSESQEVRVVPSYPPGYLFGGSRTLLED